MDHKSLKVLTCFDLSLPSAGAIEGNVPDTSGRQIADAKLLAYDLNLTLITKIYTRIEYDGTFNIGPLPKMS